MELELDDFEQKISERPDMACYKEIRTDDDPDSDIAQPSTSTGSFDRRKQRSDLKSRSPDVSFDVTMEDHEEEDDTASTAGRREESTLPKRDRHNGSRHSNHVPPKYPDTKDTKADVEADAESRELDIFVKAPISDGPIIDLRGREVLFAIGVFFFLSVSIGLMVVLASDRLKSQATPKKDTGPGTCLSQECMSRAADMMDMMDQSVAPCKDFWRYACGGWLDKHEIPPDEQSWGVDKQLKEDTERHLRTILGSEIHDERPNSAERKMKLFYRQCLNLEAIDDLGVKPIMDLMDHMGGWAIFEDWNMRSKSGTWNFQTVLRELHQKFIVYAFFSLMVRPDDMSQGNALQLDQSFLPYDMIYDDPDLEAAYKEYMRTVAKAFGADDFVEQFVNHTWEFEKQLAKIHVSEYDESRSNPYDNYDIILLSDLQEIAPRIKWLEYINGQYPEMTSDSSIMITNRDFFTSLSELLQATDERTMNYYMMWRLVDDHILYLPSEFRRAYRHFMNKYTGMRAQQSRVDFCVEKTNSAFGFAVGASFAHEYFPEGSKAEIVRMGDDIRHELVTSIQRSDWLDEDTREEAIQKAAKMNMHIGYPDFIANQQQVENYYSDFEVNRNRTFLEAVLNMYKHEMSLTKQMFYGTIVAEEWTMPIHDVNAFLIPQHNGIVFPAGLFQRPHYETSIPSYINYGGVGSVIGHEMIHGYNGMGSLYDSSGKMHIWWGMEAYMILQKKMDCVANYTSTKTYNGHKLDGHLSSNEHIADIEGLKLAYRAYKGHQKSRGHEKKMPGLDLNNDQVFFLSFAQGYCKKRRSESIPLHLSNSMHVIESLRVTGTLAQVPEFATTFSCGEKSGMLLKKRCDLWTSKR